MSWGGGHLGFLIGIENSNLVKDIPMPYRKMFKCLLLRKYKYDYSQTVHESSLDGPLQTLRFLFEDLPMIIPGQFGFNCPSGFREEAF
jgi:hypothetical protein